MSRNGFTLIELLIVVVIIGILASIAIPKFANTREKAVVAAMKSDLRNLVTAEEAYFTDSMRYTTNLGSRYRTTTGMLGPTITLLERVPFRAREPMLIATPLFHGFAFAFLALGLFLGSTIVVRRRFDAEATLAAVDDHVAAIPLPVPNVLLKVSDASLLLGRCPASGRIQF